MSSREDKRGVDECGTGKAPHTFRSYYESNAKEKQSTSAPSTDKVITQRVRIEFVQRVTKTYRLTVQRGNSDSK